MSRPTLASSDIAKHVQSVLKVIGGRAYTGPTGLPVEIRVDTMRHRVGNASGSAVNAAALRATAISNYYADIGDRQKAAAWDEMAQDLSIVSNGLPMMAPGTRKG